MLLQLFCSFHFLFFLDASHLTETETNVGLLKTEITTTRWPEEIPIVKIVMWRAR